MKKEDIIGTVFFIMLLIAFGLLYKNHERNSYREKGLMAKGLITKVEDDYKKRPYVYYRFIVGSKTYDGKTAYPEFKSNIESFLKDKVFPVIYLSDNPEKSKIIISRAEFKEVGLPFPDSLKWTIGLEMPF